MARVQYGQGIANLTGSIGGTVFSLNSSGSFARNRSNMTFSQTKNRVNNRIDLNKIIYTWGQFELVERQAWDAFAFSHQHIDPFGISTKCSGYNWFISVSSYKMLLGIGLSSVVPPWEPPVQHPSFIIEKDSIVGWQIRMLTPIDDPDIFSVILLSPPLTPSTSYVKNKYRRLLVVPTTQPSPIFLNNSILDYFSFIFPDYYIPDYFLYNISCFMFHVNKSGLIGLGHRYDVVER